MTKLSVPVQSYLGCEGESGECMFALPANCPDRGLFFCANLGSVHQDGAYLSVCLDEGKNDTVTLYKAPLLDVPGKGNYEGKEVSVETLSRELSDAWPDDFSLSRKMILAQRKNVFSVVLTEEDVRYSPDGYTARVWGADLSLPPDAAKKVRGGGRKIILPKNAYIKTAAGRVSTRDIEASYKKTRGSSLEKA